MQIKIAHAIYFILIVSDITSVFLVDLICCFFMLPKTKDTFTAHAWRHVRLHVRVSTHV